MDLKARFEDIRVPFGVPYLLLVGSSLTLTAAALVATGRRFHWFFAVMTSLAYATWLTVRFSRI
jgi:hypothetical protein